MKANELRLGNWAYVVDEESTQKKTPVQVNLTWLQIADALEPIPLNPEVLKKAGFKHRYNGDGDSLYYIGHFQLEYMEFAMPENNGFYYDNGSPWETKVESLHQLLNLYYSLTGKELEINLSETVKP